MISGFPPGLVFLLGALFIPFFRGSWKKAFLLGLPVLAGISLFQISEGIHWGFEFFGYSLVWLRVDALSMAFGYIFIIMAFSGVLFSLHVKEDKEHVAAFLYIGSSLGVVFSGDLLSLLIFWEIMAFASVFLIWAHGTQASQKAGFRYVLVHIFGGVCLLLGILMYHSETGSMVFQKMALESWGSYLIFIGFILNAAAPPLHAWLPDAYPEASVTGTVFLSAFTTKTAVYVLARSFAGTELLIWMGVIMTLYGIVWAILENDMRRILAYSIINQVGFMITGIGIGTQMALNGTISHAFCHILYKALLLMSAGAVLHMTGKTKCTDLGGLYKTMPLTLLFGLVGAASISAFPLFSGFVSKAMVITASAQENMPWVWLMLMLASAGVFLHAGIKFPYFVFFAKDSGIRTQDPPKHMLWAMGVVSFLCIFLGVMPAVLYSILPYPVQFIPYTLDHVVGQLQLLAFSALAFFLLLPKLQRTKTISLDTDWIYRKGAQAMVWFLNQPGARMGNYFEKIFFEKIPQGIYWFSQNPLGAFQIGFDRMMAQVGRWVGSSKAEFLEERVKKEKSLYPQDQITYWPIGITVLWVTLFLLVTLFLYYL